MALRKIQDYVIFSYYWQVRGDGVHVKKCVRVRGDRNKERRKEREDPENDVWIPEFNLTDLKLLMLF